MNELTEKKIKEATVCVITGFLVAIILFWFEAPSYIAAGFGGLFFLVMGIALDTQQIRFGE